MTYIHGDTKSKKRRYKELESCNPLPYNEVEELVLAYQSGDEEAGLKVWNAHRRFATKLAEEYQGKAPLDDLYQAADIGLWVSLSKFDNTRGVKLLSCSSWWIKSHISKTCRLNHSVYYVPSMPVNDPEDEEEKEEQKKKDSKTRLKRKTIALSTDFIGSKDIEEYLTYEEDIMSNMLNYDLMICLSKILNARQIAILCLHFGLDGEGEKTYEEVAKRFGISRERIRQIKEQALECIRASEHAETIKLLWEE